MVWKHLIIMDLSYKPGSMYLSLRSHWQIFLKIFSSVLEYLHKADFLELWHMQISSYCSSTSYFHFEKEKILFKTVLQKGQRQTKLVTISSINSKKQGRIWSIISDFHDVTSKAEFSGVQPTFMVCSDKACPHLFPSFPSLKRGSKTNIEHTQPLRGLRRLDIWDLREKPRFPGYIFHRICSIPHEGIMIQERWCCPSEMSSSRECLLSINYSLGKQMLSCPPLLPLQNNKNSSNY